MTFYEFGELNEKTLLFLHGGGLSWWNFREEAQLLQKEYRVILPVIDGHAGGDRPFTSIEDNAAEIISFIDGRFGGSVLLIGGLSLGGQILLEMLSQRKDICSFALVESAAAVPSALTNRLIGPAFGSSYALIGNRSFAKTQFRSLHIRPELFEDYYRDTRAISKADMIAFMKATTAYSLKDTLSGARAGIRYYYGEKENREIRRSADAIRRKLPGCSVCCIPGLRHGGFSLNRPAEYADAVREMIGT
ncbi:MAG: alpha/beta hydrolase [Clostridia bacterium]|nr:alpha/beta hydrolase [Clostridia bacterium]